MTDLIQCGPRDAKIMFVGEAPADNEMSAGRPFVGGAGQLLEHAAGRSDIRLSQCFQTNVVHKPSPYKKFENYYKKENQATYVMGLLQLKKDIETIKPNVVVALGTHALLPLAGKKGIDKWRGSILSSALVKGQKVIGTYNPAYALRVYEAKAVIELDLKRVAAEAATPDIRLPERQVIIASSGELLSQYRDEFILAEYLACDIESFEREDGSWQISCVGFSDRAGRALVIPWTTLAGPQVIDELCQCPAMKVFQNAQYDVVVLQQHGIEVTNVAWDTMYGHHALFTESAGGEDEISKLMGKKRMSVLKKGLAFQTSIYTREPYYKDDRKLWNKI